MYLDGSAALLEIQGQYLKNPKQWRAKFRSLHSTDDQSKNMLMDSHSPLLMGVFYSCAYL